MTIEENLALAIRRGQPRRLRWGITAAERKLFRERTHNLEQALRTGHRTIMMHEGRIILDLPGPERARVTVTDLLQMFEQASGTALNDDRMLLTKS